MAVRGQWEAIVLKRLDEAEHFAKRLRDEDVPLEDELFAEWMQVTEAVLLFAFGELSPLFRGFRNVAELTRMERGLYVSRLCACLYRAKRTLLAHGLPGAEREAPPGLVVPEYAQNQAAERSAERERFSWRWLWQLFWLDRHKL